jgi:hypothetical protein
MVKLIVLSWNKGFPLKVLKWVRDHTASFIVHFKLVLPFCKFSSSLFFSPLQEFFFDLKERLFRLVLVTFNCKCGDFLLHMRFTILLFMQSLLLKLPLLSFSSTFLFSCFLFLFLCLFAFPFPACFFLSFFCSFFVLFPSSFLVWCCFFLLFFFLFYSSFLHFLGLFSLRFCWASLITAESSLRCWWCYDRNSVQGLRLGTSL